MSEAGNEERYIQPLGPWGRLRERVYQWLKPRKRWVTVEELSLSRLVEEKETEAQRLRAELDRSQETIRLRELTVAGQAAIIVMYEEHFKAVAAVSASIAAMNKHLG